MALNSITEGTPPVQETKAFAAMTKLPVFRISDLSQNAPTVFDLAPDPDHMAALANDMGLLALRKLRFRGEIRALGKRDWELTATLGATVDQSCVVTLDPVTTRIDAPVERRYLAEMPEPEGDEVEMPEDDTIEPLGSVIDPAAVMAEALALNLPLYPRAEGADLGRAQFAEPGTAPLTDEDTKPFAGLAALKSKLSGDG
jgi:uncharacterized metal-binding protein YceD (DUF177 family)